MVYLLGDFFLHCCFLHNWPSSVGSWSFKSTYLLRLFKVQLFKIDFHLDGLVNQTSSARMLENWSHLQNIIISWLFSYAIFINNSYGLVCDAFTILSSECYLLNYLSPVQNVPTSLIFIFFQLGVIMKCLTKLCSLPL